MPEFCAQQKFLQEHWQIMAILSVGLLLAVATVPYMIAKHQYDKQYSKKG